MLVFGLVVLLASGMFVSLPRSFLPEEDQGYFIVVAQLPDGASKQRTDAVLERIEKFFQANPAVHSTDAMSGQNFVFGTRGPNAATMFVPLHLWDERTEPQYHVQSLIGMAYAEFAKIPEALLLAFNAPSLRGVGTVGGFSAQLQDPSGGDFKSLRLWPRNLSSARKEPAIGQVGRTFACLRRVCMPMSTANEPKPSACRSPMPLTPASLLRDLLHQ